MTQTNTNTKIASPFISVPEIAKECGVERQTVQNWLRYHRYMPFEYIVPKKPVVTREDFERFKQEHPELVNQTAQAA